MHAHRAKIRKLRMHIELKLGNCAWAKRQKLGNCASAKKQNNKLCMHKETKIRKLRMRILHRGKNEKLHRRKETKV